MLIKKGLDIPISGIPSSAVDESLEVKECAVLGIDFINLKPKLVVQEGDKVLVGTPLFYNKENPAVQMTATCSGEVVKINRGFRRALQSVVIADDGKNNSVKLPSIPEIKQGEENATTIKNFLAQCGQWVAFRTRPFSVIPDPSTVPASIFVTAIDTNPLSLEPQQIISLHKENFECGLKVLSVLAPQVHLCTDENTQMSLPAENVAQHQFSGVHPAGLAGTHIHYVDPISTTDKTVWTINYQEVIALGYLFTSGKLWNKRYIALGGPCVTNPRIAKIKLGANLLELTANELQKTEQSQEEKPVRIISGSILNGHKVEQGVEFLGRYHLQVSVMEEGLERPLLHYVQAGTKRFSKLPIYVSRFMPKKLWNFSTTTNGSSRAMVPIGIYEEIMPLDILPTQLLRALIVGDSETAQQLGCLELDEEDLALCTYVCPGKYEYGPILRGNLQHIQKEG
jgi:Na+-transporting NADH:ubiquinone oxidoreductase subunit A